MRAIVLGAAAGGGFPQWNCGCANCTRARAGDPAALPRSQASVAISADNARYMVVAASPDLRSQILATPALTPAAARGSPIGAVLALSGDIDGIAGLLDLRESHDFTLFAPQAVLDIIAANSVFGVLHPARVRRVAVMPGIATDTGLGLSLTLIELPGKTPLYQETPGADFAEPAPAYAAQLTDANGVCVIVAPACADITDAVLVALRPAQLLFFDGTFYTDNEMIETRLGVKTSRRMGHVPISGVDGSLARLADLPAQKVFLHINNSNPILLADSAARAAVEHAGFAVAFDGMMFDF